MLTTTALLLSAAAAKGFRAASFTVSLTPRRVTSTGIASTVPRGINSSQLRFAAALQNNNDSASSDDEYSRRSGDDDDDDDNSRSKMGQQRSRKQRRRSTEEKNLQRIDKVLAHRGIGSRSETFELAKARRVAFASRPDAPHEERTRIRGPKEKVPFDSSLFLDGRLLPGPPPLLLVYHKPKYVLSAMEDDVKYQDQRRRHLGEVLEDRYKRGGMHPVGRLDYDTTGLILFSLDGQLTQRLLHPRRGVEKEYVATVQGLVDEANLARKLSDGVETAEGVHTARLIDVVPSDGPAAHDDDELDVAAMKIEGDPDDDGMPDDYSGPYSDVRLVVSEGKYRMVRRMLANCGHPVEELRRLRHGRIELGELKVGEFRHATEDELEWAKSLMD
jgi:23S rRNA pseudouridine2605 synthase